MFGKKKNKQVNTNGVDDELNDFLEEADSLYIKAFETRSIGVLKDYFTRECCIALSRVIVATASSRYFSEERFRNTTWEIINRTETNVVVRKRCIYNDIHLTVTRTMKVSEDYEEVWYISVTPDEFWVTKVETE